MEKYVKLKLLNNMSYYVTMAFTHIPTPIYIMYRDI